MATAATRTATRCTKPSARRSRAGVTYVVAAGNDGANMAGSVPASYNEVLSVTAVADFNGQAGWRCCRDVPRGRRRHRGRLQQLRDAWKSPTKGIPSRRPASASTSTWKGGGCNTISGTSMASPHAAGTAALCIETGHCAGIALPTSSPSSARTPPRSDQLRLPSATQPSDSRPRATAICSGLAPTTRQISAN